MPHSAHIIILRFSDLETAFTVLRDLIKSQKIAASDAALCEGPGDLALSRLALLKAVAPRMSRVTRQKK